MSEDGIRLAVDYTDAELDAYLRALWGRQQGVARPPWGLWTIALGAVPALAGAFLLQALGTVRPRDGTVVPILLAAYWFGFWAEGARARWSERRIRPMLREDQRRAFRGTTLHVAERGIAVHRPGLKSFYEWAAILETVCIEIGTTGGLILLFTEPGRAIAIPDRLLTPAHRSELLVRVTRDD